MNEHGGDLGRVRRGRRRLPPWWAVAIAAVIIVGAAVTLVSIWGNRCDGGSNIWSTGNPHRECIGISYGGDLFNNPDDAKNPADADVIERINSVHEKIAAENGRVAEQAPRYVKVALLMPLTVSADMPSAIPLSQIQHALEGAYTAQHRINHSTIFGDPNAIEIQLLLANQGSQQDISDRFVTKVLGESETEHPLAAVIGLGSSVPNTEKLVDRLGSEPERIPMVGAITSSDSLTGRPNFWSVSPSNIHYAQALRNFLDRQENLKSGLILRDQNKDPYTRTLTEAFRSHLEPYLGFPELTYHGGTLEDPATPTVFQPKIGSICSAVLREDLNQKEPLDMVFYAGRVADFEPFAEALEDRVCQDEPLAVLVGATGFADAQRYVETLDKGNVTVIYSSSSDPEAWLRGGVGTPPDFAAFTDAFAEAGFEEADLADGIAIAHHDAFAAVAVAIRLAAQGALIPEPADVAAEFNLVLDNRVRAAAGLLSLPTSAGGRAVNRVIPVRQLGTSTPFLVPEDMKPYKVGVP